MRIDKTLHPLAKDIIEKSQTKEDMYKLVASIDEWYLKQLDIWMKWIIETDADKDMILKYIDSVAMPLRLQIPSRIKTTNPEWEEAWDMTHENASTPK